MTHCIPTYTYKPNGFNLNDSSNHKQELILSQADSILNRIYEKLDNLKITWIDNVDIKKEHDLNLITLNYDRFLDVEMIYMINLTDNTILNLYQNSEGIYQINIPGTKKVRLLGFGLRQGKVFALKKDISITKDTVIDISFEKVRKESITNYFKD